MIYPSNAFALFKCTDKCTFLHAYKEARAEVTFNSALGYPTERLVGLVAWMRKYWGLRFGDLLMVINHNL